MAFSSTIQPLPQNLDAYRISLEAMRQFVLKDYVDLRVRRLAEQILQEAGVRGHDHRAEVAALLNWVQASIRYVRDPYQIEMVKDPIRLLETGQGDCDDMATLLAALLASVGFQSRFVASSPDGIEPSHVFLEVEVDDEWISADPVKQDAPLGWRVPHAKFDYVYPIFDEGGSMSFGAYDYLGNYYTPPASGGIDWGQEIDTGLRTLPSILYAAQGVPYTPGGYYSGSPIGPGGQIGAQASYNIGNQSAGFGLNLSSGTWQLIILSLVAFLILKKK